MTSTSRSATCHSTSTALKSGSCVSSNKLIKVHRRLIQSAPCQQRNRFHPKTAPDRTDTLPMLTQAFAINSSTVSMVKCQPQIACRTECKLWNLSRSVQRDNMSGWAGVQPQNWHLHVAGPGGQNRMFFSRYEWYNARRIIRGTMSAD